MRTRRRRAPRRGAFGLAIIAFAGLTALGGGGARAEENALLVSARDIESLPAAQRAQAQREIDRMLLEAELRAQRSPLTVEQLALAVGCDVRADTCLVHLSRDVANRLLLVPMVVARSPELRVELRAISGRTGRVTTVAGKTASSEPLNAGTQRGILEASASSPPVGERSAGPAAATRSDGRPSQPARIVGTSALSASAVMLAFGVSRLVRSRKAADSYADAEFDTTEGIDRAHDLHDEATHDARIARGVLSGAALLGVSGVAALLWHRWTGGEPGRAPAVTAQISQQGAVFAVRGTWGTGL